MRPSVGTVQFSFTRDYHHVQRPRYSEKLMVRANQAAETQYRITVEPFTACSTQVFLDHIIPQILITAEGDTFCIFQFRQ